MNTVSESILPPYSRLQKEAMGLIEVEGQDGRPYLRAAKSGLHYAATLPVECIKALEDARERDCRVRLFPGNIQTGLAWAEERDIMGRIGSTTGPLHSPILVHSKRSFGGGIIGGNIVAVRELSSGRWLYKHAAFHTRSFTVGCQDRPLTEPYTWPVLQDEALHARFATRAQAQRYCQFMMGERNAK